MSSKTQKKPRQKAHIIKNTAFMLGCGLKSAPLHMLIIYLAYAAENVYYAVVVNVMFLETALSIIEGNGTFSEFVLRMCIIVVGKLLIDLLGYVNVYTVRIKFEIKCESYINSLIFKKAQQVELGCYENPEFFDKYNRATWVVEQNGFKRIIEGSAWVLGSVISLILLVFYLVSIDPFLLIFLFCSIIVVAFRVAKNNLELEKEKDMTPYEREKDYVRRTILLKDFAKEIKTTSIFVVLEKRFRNAIEKNIGVIKKYGWKIALLEIISDYFAEIIPVTGGFVYGCYRLIVTGDIAISDFSVLVSAIATCRNKLNHLAFYFAMQQKHCLWVQNLREFLDYEPKIQGGELEPDEFSTLEFKNVSFRYTDTSDYVLKNISFKVSKGQTIAVVGHNGAGKTTLSKLLLRFYDVTEGEILYNGINVKEYDLLKYRSKFSSVFQDYRVFAMTVAENVLTEEVTEENRSVAVNALKLSGAYDKISALPYKEDSLLTKEFDAEGVLLSGGETQKVTIARLFAGEFDIAILDEPSSALDPIAEAEIYSKFNDISGDKTAIYISHRLSSCKFCDEIAVFHDGAVIQQGTHDGLLADTTGKYHELWHAQAQYYTDRTA